jgi:hypothetical protein
MPGRDKELIYGALVVLAILVVVALSKGWFAGGGQDRFEPVPVSTCGRPYEYDREYAVDMAGAAGTVALTPYSTQSKVSLERGAGSPEVAELFREYAPNPVSGLGKTSAVRAMGDRYRRDDVLSRLSMYELQPGEPGYMEEIDDGSLNLMAAVTRRAPPPPGGRSAFCASAASETEIDSDFFTDGPYGAAVLCGGAGACNRCVSDPRVHGDIAGVREALTSTRVEAPPNTLTASKTGLGSTRMDPRFEPGPQERVASGDASPAPGSYAGGITLGAFGSPKFQTSGGWQFMPVYGFGEPERAEYGPVEAIITGESMW